MEREVGGGIRMGNTCKSMADSFQCMTKPTTIKKEKEISFNLKKRGGGQEEETSVEEAAVGVGDQHEYYSHARSLKTGPKHVDLRMKSEQRSCFPWISKGSSCLRQNLLLVKML